MLMQTSPSLCPNFGLLPFVLCQRAVLTKGRQSLAEARLASWPLLVHPYDVDTLLTALGGTDCLTILALVLAKRACLIALQLKPHSILEERQMELDKIYTHR